MSGSSQKHLAAIGAQFATHLIGLGFTQAQVMQGIGMTLEALSADGALAPIESLTKLFERGVSLTGDGLMPLKWAETRDFTGFGVIGYLGRSSADVRTWLENIARFRRIISEPIDIDLSTLDTDGSFVWTYNSPANVNFGPMVEAQTLSFIRGLEPLLPRGLNPKLVEFEHRRTQNLVAFQRFFNCPVAFGAKRNRVVFHQQDLDLEIKTRDTQLNRILVEHCKMVLAQTAPGTPDIQIKVERAISTRLATGHATVGQVAHDLGMSARTLARRLGDANTTFQAVLSNLRRALAERYLKDGAMSQSEIAFLLGYSDVSSFAAAFKRWTGRPPGEIRHMSA